MDYVGSVNLLLVDWAVVQGGNVRIVPLGVDLSTWQLLFASSCVCFCLLVCCLCFCATDSFITSSLTLSSLTH